MGADHEVATMFDVWRIMEDKNMPLSDSGHQVCGEERCKAAATQISEMSLAPSIASGGTDFQLPNTIALCSGSLFEMLQASAQSTMPPSLPHTHTTASLQAQEHIIRTNAAISAGRVTDKVTAEIKYRVDRGLKKPKIEDTYGSIKCPFDSTDSLWAVQDYTLQQFNVVHTKTGAKPPVDVSETLLRQQDNRTIESSMMGFTLQQWQQHLIEQGLLLPPGLTPSSTMTIRTAKAQTSQATAKSILSFELFVMLNMYEDRIEGSIENAGFSSGQFASVAQTWGQGKHRNRSGSMLSTLAPGPSKMAHIFNTSSQNNQLRSYFRLPAPSTQRTLSITSTKLEFTKLVCSALSPQGDPVFEKSDKTLIGYLADSPFAKGTMKGVFEVVFVTFEPSYRYVAKRFYRLSDNQESGGSSETESQALQLPKVEFGVADHNDYIKLEIVRLACGDAFLKDFFKFCRDKEVNIYRALRFTDAFLLQERSEISPASGLNEVSSNGTEDSNGSFLGLMWMIEKRHASERVQKFCGTLRHVNSSSDLAHLTVAAFNHFVYGVTQGELIFADLQGTPGLVAVNGKDTKGIILFDPMTHTANGESGIGDFGNIGIEKFETQHKCKEICTLLGLDEDAPLNALEGDISKSPGSGNDESAVTSNSEGESTLRRE